MLVVKKETHISYEVSRAASPIEIMAPLVSSKKDVTKVNEMASKHIAQSPRGHQSPRGSPKLFKASSKKDVTKSLAHPATR